MKLILSLFSISAIFYSCTKTDKSMLNAPCTDSCTIIQGRFITGNNEGIANIQLEIKSEIRPTLGLGQTTIRKIANGKTDNNGFYSLKFALNERKHGLMAAAKISIHFNYDKSKFIPVTWYENFGTIEFLGTFSRKDTTTTANIYLSSKSKLKVRLENFIPVQTGDNFSVITYCGAGLERRYSSGGYIEANQLLTELEIDACGNEETTVIVRKRKNGINSSSTSIISIPSGQTTAVTFTY